MRSVHLQIFVIDCRIYFSYSKRMNLSEYGESLEWYGDNLNYIECTTFCTLLLNYHQFVCLVFTVKERPVTLFEAPCL